MYRFLLVGSLIILGSDVSGQKITAPVENNSRAVFKVSNQQESNSDNIPDNALSKLASEQDWDELTGRLIALIRNTYESNGHPNKAALNQDILGVSRIYIDRLFYLTNPEQYRDIVAISDAVLYFLPDKEAFIIYKARALTALKNHHEAILLLEEIQRLNPMDTKSLYLLAENYLSIDMANVASGYYQKLLLYGDPADQTIAETILSEVQSK